MPANPTSTGPLARPLILLAELVAESLTFRRAVGLEDNDSSAAEKLLYGEQGAKRRVYWPTAGSEVARLKSLFPVAVVARAEGAFAYKLAAGGGRNYLVPEGGLRLILAARAEHAEQSAAQIAFENFAGGVLADIARLAASDGRLAIHEIREEGVGLGSSETEDAATGEPWWVGMYLVSWR